MTLADVLPLAAVVGGDPPVSLPELGVAGGLLALVGVLGRWYVGRTDATHARAVADLKEAHAQTLAVKDQHIAGLTADKVALLQGAAEQERYLRTEVVPMLTRVTLALDARRAARDG